MIGLDCDCFFVRYFKEYGWPSSTIFETPPENDKDREKLIDIVQVEYPFFFFFCFFPLFLGMPVFLLL